MIEAQARTVIGQAFLAVRKSRPREFISTFRHRWPCVSGALTDRLPEPHVTKCLWAGSPLGLSQWEHDWPAAGDRCEKGCAAKLRKSHSVMAPLAQGRR